MLTNFHHIHKIQSFTAYLLISNFPTISHISVVARKWIIIIQAKYLMFPLFERGHKQMRHQQFIARTITQRLFPTVRPGLAAGLASASQQLGWSQLRVQTTAALTHIHTHTDHHCRVMLTTHAQNNTSMVTEDIHATMSTVHFLQSSLVAKQQSSFSDETASVL